MKKFIKTYLIDEFGKREGESLDEKAEQKLAQLNNNAPGKSKTQQRYLMGSIFPVISVYQTFQQSGMTKEKAIIHMEKMIGENTRNHTRKMWEMLGKLPFFFSLFKLMFRKGLTGDSWDVSWVADNKTNFEFEIHRCLWHDMFKEYGCPELCAIFCHNDEINFTDVSKYLKFYRENSLGYGGAYCDFHFYAKERPGEK
ncbi:L-2-amino-thiazoline-4-carboxylic acid hydrolase [Syntrophobotulus glycolicus]|nr:L-2-amino-thiazoline-4-carboxylic acid hydrolase [Syntrophobotulus glycolicus]